MITFPFLVHYQVSLNFTLTCFSCMYMYGREHPDDMVKERIHPNNEETGNIQYWMLIVSHKFDPQSDDKKHPTKDDNRYI